MGRALNRARDLLFLEPLEELWWKRREGTVTMLVYHRVGDCADTQFLTSAGSPVIEPDTLGRELSFLREKGARFLTLRDIREGRFPERPEVGVVVTFDDGFKDNYVNGLPVLEALGIKAVFFQSTALVDAPTLIWEHALYWYAAQPALLADFKQLLRSELTRPPVDMDWSGMDWIGRLRDEVPAQDLERLLEIAGSRLGGKEEMEKLAAKIYPCADDLKRAADAGHEIGSHGHRHYRRDAIDAAAFEDELSHSVKTLETITNQAVGAFSYPFSSFADGDDEITGRFFEQAAVVDGKHITRHSPPLRLSRCSWPGAQRNRLRERRWLLTGSV